MTSNRLDNIIATIPTIANSPQRNYDRESQARKINKLIEVREWPVQGSRTRKPEDNETPKEVPQMGGLMWQSQLRVSTAPRRYASGTLSRASRTKAILGIALILLLQSFYTQCFFCPAHYPFILLRVHILYST
jgi:hypothetical protein